jgi:hypothetical protein
MKNILTILMAFVLITSACQPTEPQNEPEKSATQMMLDEYAEFTLTTDMAKLSDKEKQMIPLLIEVAKIMDNLFWKEAYGDKAGLMASLEDEAAKGFASINYGPWDRLRDNKSFIDGVGEKPLGAQYYPEDMTKEEFEAFESDNKGSLYTFVKRDENGALYTEYYHEAFADEVTKASELLKKAAALAEDEGLKNYLNLRAEALLSDDYLASDMAWMEMKENHLDFVVGPIETYEDHLYGAKAAHEAYVLVKDLAWSERLAKYVNFLPELQSNLPVADEYKQEEPGTVENSEVSTGDEAVEEGEPGEEKSKYLLGKLEERKKQKKVEKRKKKKEKMKEIEEKRKEEEAVMDEKIDKLRKKAKVTKVELEAKAE